MIAVAENMRKIGEAGFQAHEREIVKLSRELEFTVTCPRNKAHVLVESKEKIVEIAIDSTKKRG
ncbi:MAG: hypothetical protein WC566_06380 [Dehalococcoidia bacterium]